MKQKNLYSGKYISLGKIELSNGKSWEMVSRNGNTKTVAGLVYHREKKQYIFISQMRYPLGERVIEMPAGIQDKGVSSEEHLRQEIQEEIGYRNIESMEYLGNFPSSGGLTNETSLLYYVELSGNQGEQNISKSEDIEILHISENNIRKFIQQSLQDGKYIDSKIAMALYLIEDSPKK